MALQVRVEGSWPGPLTFTLGWFRARARPWNDEIADPMLRLERGGSDFLQAVSRQLLDLAPSVYSPALYPGSTRVWRRSGYAPYAELDVMECPLPATLHILSNDIPVEQSAERRWDDVLSIDRAAFEGFWGMSRLGLEEAYDTNRSNVLLVSPSLDDPAGYALVGAQWGVVYLHRIAVHPDHAGQGMGSAILDEAMTWGRSQGGKTMVLNLRSGNDAARRLYERHGFVETGTRLQVLRHERR